MTPCNWLTTVVLATTLVSSLHAETQCPGNAASVPLHPANRYQAVDTVSVFVNHTGPYNFLLDTGTEITIVDSSLAAELHLTTEGSAEITGAGFHASAAFAQVDRVEVGSHSVASTRLLVYSLQPMRGAGIVIQGVLGEDFLQHFDVLIDNAHNRLCLDDTGVMRAAIKGPHIPLETSVHSAGGAEALSSLVVTVNLSDGMRPLRMQLDSGATAPVLYDAFSCLAIHLSPSAMEFGTGANGVEETFVHVPPQNVRIGSVKLPSVPFVAVTGLGKASAAGDFDGLLPLGLFRRVFICHTEHFVVLESR
jgi:hypothetical protein